MRRLAVVLLVVTSATAAAMADSSRTSSWIASAWPPAASISFATE